MTQNPPPRPQLAGPRLTPPHRDQPGLGPGLPAKPAVVPMLPTRLRQPGREAPLPDVVAVRRLPVPDPAPPYDDEIAVEAIDTYAGNEVIVSSAPVDHGRTERGGAGDSSASHSGADQGGADQGGADDGGADQGADDGRADDGRADDGRADDGRADDDSAGRGPSAPSGGSRPPDPAAAWPSQFAQVLAETLAGSRPAQQLTPWTTEQTRRRIRQLGPMLATDQRPRVRRVMTSAPAPGVLEMTAVVGFGPRVRALALRLEHEQARPYRPGGSRWCCTAIESA
jgi:hypothetical protein